MISSDSLLRLYSRHSLNINNQSPVSLKVMFWFESYQHIAEEDLASYSSTMELQSRRSVDHSYRRYNEGLARSRLQ